MAFPSLTSMTWHTSIASSPALPFFFFFKPSLPHQLTSRITPPSRSVKNKPSDDNWTLSHRFIARHISLLALNAYEHLSTSRLRVLSFYQSATISARANLLDSARIVPASSPNLTAAPFPSRFSIRPQTYLSCLVLHLPACPHLVDLERHVDVPASRHGSPPKQLLESPYRAA